jgi:hypothetical protein
MSMVGSPLSSYEITYIELSIYINHIHINPISCFHPIFIYIYIQGFSTRRKLATTPGVPGRRGHDQLWYRHGKSLDRSGAEDGG